MDQILQIISKRLGLRVGDKDAARVRKLLVERSRRLSHEGLPRYAQFLEDRSHDSEQEWQELASLLTTGETYFFRDAGQIRLLQTQVLPSLIEQRQPARSLRIWSAGCSSGEEAYSIAMLLDDLLPERGKWQITILGTDIDHCGLERAENAAYTDWSFRNVSEEMRQRYFQQSGQEWQLDPGIRSQVSFQPMNLLTASLPNATFRDLDLIVCRNVFIYFEREHVVSVFNKFADTLRHGGCLLTGHGELQGVDTSRLTRKVFDESILHQKMMPAKPASIDPARRAERRRHQGDAAPESFARAPADPAHCPPTRYEEIEELLRAGQPQAVIEQAKLLAQTDPDNSSLLTLLARAHADLGDYGEAAACCEQAMSQDPFAVGPRYLLAKLAEAENNYLDAKSHLRRVLYLEPSHLAAGLDLAELFDREGDAQQARKHRLAAIELLASLPPGEPVEVPGTPSASELRQHLQRLVNDG